MTSSLVAPREELAMVLSPFARASCAAYSRSAAWRKRGGDGRVCRPSSAMPASRSFPWSIRRPRVAGRSA